MNDDELSMYADFIMGMRQRARQESNKEWINENFAAEKLYGDMYVAIREDFQKRVDDKL